mgnify:CR=1 FL=1
MIQLKEEQLDNLRGGDSSYVTGPIISAVVSIIKLIRDAGYDLGSGIRRAAEDEVCPLR